MPLTRSWCLFEVLQTYRLLGTSASETGFEGLVYCTADGVLGGHQEGDDNDERPACYDVAVALSDRLANLNVKDAEATDPEDRRKILEEVEKEGGISSMNQFLRHNMHEALQRVEASFLGEIARLNSNLLHNHEEGSSPTSAREVALAWPHSSPRPPKFFAEKGVWSPALSPTLAAEEAASSSDLSPACLGPHGASHHPLDVV